MKGIIPDHGPASGTAAPAAVRLATVNAGDDPSQPAVSWSIGATRPGAGGYVTEVPVRVENPAAAENLALLVKSDVPLTGFSLYDGGPEPRRLRDGREMVVARGDLRADYVARITTAEAAPIEVEAVLDVPFWG
jgi:hypothetical protein